MALDREKTLQTAQRYVDRKKYDRAIAEYQRVVRADPADARTRLKIGDLQARTGAFADAISTYDEVGRYYASNGFALKAIAVYKQIRELIERHVPELADRYGHILPKLAEIYAELGLISDALAAYDEVASRMQKAGRDQEAVEVFRRMVALDASNPLPQLRYAEACIRIDDVDVAIEAFAAAARVLLSMGRRDDALRVFERILHFRAEPKYAFPTAELYLQRGTQQDGMQALAKLQVCFQANPHDLATLELLSRAFTTIGQMPKSIEVKKEMARIAYDQGQYDKHQEIAEQLLRMAPEDEQVQALAAMKPRPGSMPPAEDVLIEEDDFEELDVDDAEELPIEELEDFEEAEVLLEEVDVVAEVPSSVSRPVNAQRMALADAESFRSLRLYDKAIATLRMALEEDPSAADLREALRDTLAESGDRSGALAEMVSLAQLYWEQGNLAQARSELDELLEVDPGNREAAQLLASMSAGGPPSQNAFGALTSHDVEGGVAAALSEAPPRPADPLPELDLESVHPAQSRMEQEVAEVLDEVEFYCSRELFEDARQVLGEQLGRTPGHPAVAKRLAELDARMRPSIVPDEAVLEAPPASDRAFDIAASLEAMGPPSVVPGSTSTAATQSQVDVDAVFAQFKAGVRAQVSEADSSTHYDLAVAYKEMGLLSDAIMEFEIAARAPTMQCTCLAMVGAIHTEQGNYDEAIAAFKRAFNSKAVTKAQKLSILYDVGNAYELNQDYKQAVAHFKQLVQAEPGYRDVKQRLAKLESRADSVSSVHDIDTAFDEVDEAFERLLDSK